MNTNGVLRAHWFHVTLHFLIDAAIFCGAFCGGIFLRFGAEAATSFWTYLPIILLGAVIFPSVVYILGLYSTHSAHQNAFERAIALLSCTIVASLLVIGGSYAITAHPLGRSVMLISALASFLLVVIHHAFLLHALHNSRERVAYVVGNPSDELETRLFTNFSGKNLQLVGVVLYNGYQLTGPGHVLGRGEQLAEIVQREKIDRVLCSNKSLTSTRMTRHFCKLRYSGISVMPLIILCEEIEQYVPLELINAEWLLNASGEPQLIYIKKIKRLFDIVSSIVGLILSAPILLLAVIAIAITSPGPIFYRQSRAGRFGKEFSMLKLRTMCVDAEKYGAQWSQTSDPRVTFIGRFLRRYRIDEIPQLWQVLTGHLSFVGPRPERPEMIEMLATEVRYYEERAMVQPGLTGWAQVSYPYGSSVQDARRKLEYDLYYMKHMSLFLDLFILLDTIRIVIFGGAIQTPRPLEEAETLQEWVKLRDQEVPLIPHAQVGLN